MRALLQIYAASFGIRIRSHMGRIRICFEFSGTYQNTLQIPGVATGRNGEPCQDIAGNNQGATIKITLGSGHLPAVVDDLIIPRPSVGLRITKIIISADLLHDRRRPFCQFIIQALYVYIPRFTVPSPGAYLLCRLIPWLFPLNCSIFINACMANQYRHLFSSFLKALHGFIYRISPGHILAEYSVTFR